jgi:hypothetical protein
MKRVQEDGDWTLFSPDETPELPETYGKEFYEADTKEKRVIAGRLYVDEIKKLLEPRSNRYCMISFYDCLWYNDNGQLKIWRWNFNTNTKVKSK